jgi:3-deoxy-manno-octulosonate cytidylyltransferase (CMP-KDO synthetase)
MIQHVVERAREVKLADRVVVATDDGRIAAAVESFGAEVVMTLATHPSGTDRLVEVAKTIPGDLFVNIQGDEPLVRPADIDLLIAGMLADANLPVGTLCHALPAAEASDPNFVKVVVAANGDALYFSRACIPFRRDDGDPVAYLKHVGVYAYRRNVLEEYSALGQPMIERAEKLEQLRLLHAGLRIRAFEVEPTGPGVDTLESLGEVRRLLEEVPLGNGS